MFFNIQLIGLGSTILLIGSPIIANSIGGWSTLLYSGLITLIFFILWKSDLNKFYLIPWLGLFLSLYRPDGVVVGSSIVDIIKTSLNDQMNGNEMKNKVLKYVQELSEGVKQGRK